MRGGAIGDVTDRPSWDFAEKERSQVACSVAPARTIFLGPAMNEIVREFLLETQENLAQLDLDLVKLEKEPTERETLARVFRTLHTVKGTAGFLGLMKLQAVAHSAENLLSRLRSGEMTFNATIATALLSAVDAVRQMLECVERTEKDGDADYSAQIQVLETLIRSPRSESAIAAPPKSAPISPPAPVPPPPSVEERTFLASAADLSALRTDESPQSVNSLIGARSASKVSSNSSVEMPASTAPGISDTAIRVDVGVLDKLMTLVGELVLARNQIVQFSSSQDEPIYLNTVQRLNLLTSELQASVMKTRMQPIGTAWAKYPRLVRDLSLACGKQVRLEMEGRETELDKTILEAIRDPLTHLVRNAIDHGLEAPADRLAKGKSAEGRLALHASHEGGKVVLRISDDGAGIDPERVREKAVRAKLLSVEQAAGLGERELLRLIFLPGFSTTDQVTQFSGRGVGMDVVRTNIERIGGTVDVESQRGRGVTVTMKIPLTLAIIPALTIAAGGEHFAIPQVSLLELVRVDRQRQSIEHIHGAPVYRLRGNLLPLVRLDEQLGLRSRHTESGVYIVVLQAEDRQFGLIVDEIHDTQEIVVKPLQKQLKSVRVFSGATIMGNGKVALILDVVALAQRARVLLGRHESAILDAPNLGPAASERPPILLCELNREGRIGIPVAAISRLEEFPRSAIERIGSERVVQYRGDVLPLVDLARALRGRKPSASGNSARKDSSTPRRQESLNETLHVVVCASSRGLVGLIVASVLDIVHEEIVDRSRTNRTGVSSTAVVQGAVTRILDVDAVIASTVERRRQLAGSGD
jgi:two-component system chemotaxis sensor kinase CheA